jgi:DNA-dependent RNA polymerase auxiliary subunit epsilon
LKSGGNIKIFSEPLNVQAKSKIDDKNLHYEKNGGNIQVIKSAKSML